MKKYKSRNVPITKLLVSETEIELAFAQVSNDFLNALQIARTNLEQVCLNQIKLLKSEKTTSLLNSQVNIWRRWLPMESVGIYAPGGNADYPSSVIMATIPALVAGISNLVLTVPPKPDGSVPAEVVVTARSLGISQIFKVGGPQAIAALAFGTQSIPKVDLAVGPGNQYVTAAKLALFPLIQIDIPAGPSENVIIADETADPEFIAADLITDCEHGTDSTGILLTDSPSLAKIVQKEIAKQLKKIPTQITVSQAFAQYGAVVVTKDLDEAIQLTNEYAPEHLQIFTKSPMLIATKIRNAGSIFLGQYSAKAVGDYCSGANHILPTGKAARQFGPVSVETFGRWQEFQEISKQGFYQLAKTAQVFAQVEELPAHEQSVLVRLGSRKR